jgi:hypothetical protein
MDERDPKVVMRNEEDEAEVEAHVLPPKDRSEDEEPDVEAHSIFSSVVMSSPPESTS